jgi:RNA methyltransferase, TrmH family
VQAAKALQTRAEREKQGVFLCEGEHMVAEALRYAPENLQTVFVDDVRINSFRKLLEDIPEAKIIAVSQPALMALSQVKTPQGIAATVTLPGKADPAQMGDRVVLLENVQDPGNVGTILRTADAAGFHECLLTPGCADPFSPKALRATMGSVFRVPVTRTESASQAAKKLADNGYLVIATTLDGEDFFKHGPFPQKVCLIIGNEGAGISPETSAAATKHYRLPMRGGAESLNAAIAAAVFMYEIVNRGSPQ